MVLGALDSAIGSLPEDCVTGSLYDAINTIHELISNKVKQELAEREYMHREIQELRKIVETQNPVETSSPNISYASEAWREREGNGEK